MRMRDRMARQRLWGATFASVFDAEFHRWRRSPEINSPPDVDNIMTHAGMSLEEAERIADRAVQIFDRRFPNEG